jgi:hypothetical protein
LSFFGAGAIRSDGVVVPGPIFHIKAILTSGPRLGGHSTVKRLNTVRHFYAVEAGFGKVRILPIENVYVSANRRSARVSASRSKCYRVSLAGVFLDGVAGF